MDKYQKELQGLKPWDEVQGYVTGENCTHAPNCQGYGFIYTAGHGYLVVDKNDNNASLAKQICKYGFTGKLAYYLEEDCEAGDFLTAIS